MPINVLPGHVQWTGQSLEGCSHLVGARHTAQYLRLECGYSASAIRERIYAGDAGYGILLHTGTPDSEGTLGGLVHVGRRIEEHLRSAIELGRLCSNDPESGVPV